jgi:hypothetical protein
MGAAHSRLATLNHILKLVPPRLIRRLAQGRWVGEKCGAFDAPSHKGRNPETYKAPLWRVLAFLKGRAHRFGREARSVGLPRRIRKVSDVICTTGAQLVSNSVEWAEHRRREATAKTRPQLSPSAFLPDFAAGACCKTFRPGEAMADVDGRMSRLAFITDYFREVASLICSWRPARGETRGKDI